jgi:hypothetical protein
VPSPLVLNHIAAASQQSCEVGVPACFISEDNEESTAPRVSGFMGDDGGQGYTPDPQVSAVHQSEGESL